MTVVRSDTAEGVEKASRRDRTVRSGDDDDDGARFKKRSCAQQRLGEERSRERGWGRGAWSGLGRNNLGLAVVGCLEGGAVKMGTKQSPSVCAACPVEEGYRGTKMIPGYLTETPAAQPTASWMRCGAATAEQGSNSGYDLLHALLLHAGDWTVWLQKGDVQFGIEYDGGRSCAGRSCRVWWAVACFNGASRVLGGMLQLAISGNEIHNLEGTLKDKKQMKRRFKSVLDSGPSRR